MASLSIFRPGFALEGNLVKFANSTAEGLASEQYKQCLPKASA